MVRLRRIAALHNRTCCIAQQNLVSPAINARHRMCQSAGVGRDMDAVGSRKLEEIVI
jgi:hypothetical protein